MRNAKEWAKGTKDGKSKIDKEKGKYEKEKN
jgi:hypothetical protein